MILWFHDSMTNATRVHVQVLIPPVCCHQGLFLAHYCTVMSQRRKSAITFPYIILMSSHSNTDPCQPILTHEIWQAAPEVMQLLLGNRIMINRMCLPGFQRRIWFSCSNSLIWAGIASKRHLCACASHSVFVVIAQLFEHRRVLPAGVWGCSLSLLGAMDSQFLGIQGQFSRHARDLCFLSSCQMRCSLVLLMWGSQLSQGVFSLPYNWNSRCEKRCCWSWLVGHKLLGQETGAKFSLWRSVLAL